MRSFREMMIIIILGFMAALVLLRFIVHDHDNLFVAAEAVHSLGISVLIYKLMKEKTYAGLSLKSQELTAIFLAVRLYCSFVMEYDIHTILDLATFVTTVWVIYMIRFKLKASYMEEKANFAIYYVMAAFMVGIIFGACLSLCHMLKACRKILPPPPATTALFEQQPPFSVEIQLPPPPPPPDTTLYALFKQQSPFSVEIQLPPPPLSSSPDNDLVEELSQLPSPPLSAYEELPPPPTLLSPPTLPSPSTPVPW